MHRMQVVLRMYTLMSIQHVKCSQDQVVKLRLSLQLAHASAVGRCLHQVAATHATYVVAESEG